MLLQPARAHFVQAPHLNYIELGTACFNWGLKDLSVFILKVGKEA
jgi:hypothetical protein